jgi:hypothetical protein
MIAKTQIDELLPAFFIMTLLMMNSQAGRLRNFHASFARLSAAVEKNVHSIDTSTHPDQRGGNSAVGKAVWPG